MEILTATILALAAGLVRNVSGWAENALRDGKIDSYEYRQLAGTLATYVATVNVLALGLTPEQATVVTYILDMVRTALKGYATTGK